MADTQRVAFANASGRPRPGQWCKFKLSPDAAKSMQSLGAWQTADGYFVGLYLPASTEPVVEVVNDEKGVKERTGGAPIPERIMLVDAAGRNVQRIVEDADGNKSLVNVYYSPASPSLSELQPVVKKGDCPPGRNVTEDPKP